MPHFPYNGDSDPAYDYEGPIATRRRRGLPGFVFRNVIRDAARSPYSIRRLSHYSLKRTDCGPGFYLADLDTPPIIYKARTPLWRLLLQLILRPLVLLYRLIKPGRAHANSQAQAPPSHGCQPKKAACRDLDGADQSPDEA